MRPAPVLRHRRPDLIHRAAVPRGIRKPEPVPPTHSESAQGLAALLGLDIPSSRLSVSESNVSGLAAVDAGVEMVAHAVATMMAEAQVFNAEGEEIDVPAIVRRPTPLYGAYEFYSALVRVVMMRGNGPGVLADYDPDGYPRQVVPCHPDAVSLDDSTGLPYYTIGSSTLDWTEVLHVRHGAPWGSLWGRGIIEKYRHALERQLGEQEYGRTAFTSGGVPTVHVQLDRADVPDEVAEGIDARWQERFGNGVRKPLVTGKAISVKELTWSPEDAEWVENRKTSVGEAALMCGLHPADLGASLGGSLDYANLTDRQLSRVLQSYSPWMRLIEEEFSDQLPGGAYVRGNVEALLRTSTAERFAVYEVGERLGIYTRPELREMERRPKLPESDITPPAPVAQNDNDENDNEETSE